MPRSNHVKPRFSKPDSYIGVRVPFELRERLYRLAVAERNGLSAVARRLIAEALSREQCDGESEVPVQLAEGDAR